MVRRINLVPPNERRRTQTDFGLLVLIMIGVLLLGAMTITYFRHNAALSERETTLAEAQMRNQQLQSQLVALAAYDQLEQQRQQAELVAQQVYAGRTLVSEILGDISLVVPDTVWFSKLTLTTPDVVAVAPTPPANPGGQTGASGASAAPASAAAAAKAATAAQGKLDIDATTYTFDDVAGFLVRLDLISALRDVQLKQASIQAQSQTSGSSSNDADLKKVGIAAGVVNTQPGDASLPITQVEVAK